MDKFRRFLALLLVLCLTLSVAPLSALAAEGEDGSSDEEIVVSDEESGTSENDPEEDSQETPEDSVIPVEPGEDSQEDSDENSNGNSNENSEESTTQEDETVQSPEVTDDTDEEEDGIDSQSEDDEDIDLQSITISKKPADGTTTGQPFASGTGGSANFRIPALVTLKNGTLVAAADARWDHTSDGYGLDTIVSRSIDGGANWSYTFANYLGDNGNTYNTSSTAFIDPALATDGTTIYMLVDLYPTGGYINQIKSGTGFNDEGYLMLCADGSESFDYYLKDGLIYSTDGEAVPGYTVDAYFNITGNDYETNLFFSDSPYKVLVTSYLYLTKSTDGGESWSAPMMLNSQVKNSSESFYGVGPGGGIVTSNGRIIFPCYTYTTEDGNTSVIYSDDGGRTWTRSADMNVQTSEASISEVTLNGQNYLYMFTRHGGYFTSSDNGTTWSTQQSVSDISYTTSCELSTLTYSRTIDGHPAILLSAPTSGRTTGKIFVGLVQDDGSISWAYTYAVNGSGDYAYSDLAELSDGSIGLLYENGSGSITYTKLPITDIAPNAEIGGANEECILSDDPTGVTVNFGTITVESMAVNETTVDGLDGKTYVAYNITPNDFTDSAVVTIPLTEELKAAAKLTGFVVEEDGTITEKAGSKTDDGNGYTFTALHFSVMGVMALADEGSNVTETKEVTLYVGQSTTITDSTGNYGTGTVRNDTVARVTTEGTTVEGGTTKTLGSTVSMNSDGTYTGVISDGNDNYLVLNGTTISSTTDINQATEWTVTRSYYGYSYTIQSGSYYLSHSNNSLTASTSSSSWYYSSGFYYSNRGSSYYLRTNNGAWQLSTTNSNKGQLYSVTTSTTDPVDATTITFTGKDVGTASVVVGTTRYNITVKEAPEYVDSSTTPFVANTGVGDGKAVTKLTTSVGLTFDIDLADGYSSGGTWSIADTSIATVDSDGKVTGVSAGETTLTYTVNGVSYTMPVVIRQDTTSSNTKIYDFYLSEVTDTTVYYSVSMSTDLVEAQEGEAIYISCGATDDTAVDFFAKPNEGYALTRMSSTNSAGDYMALNSDTPSETDFCTKSGAAGSNQINTFGSDAVYAMVQAALDKECDGGMGWTRPYNNTSGVTSDLTFRSEKLPTVDKTIQTVNGVAYTEGMTAKAGETIVYQVTVTQYAAKDTITYSNATLTDNLTDAKFSESQTNTQSVVGLSNTALSNDNKITYTVEYVITDDDLDTDIINTVDLTYTYKSQYSSGSFGGSASAEAKISAPTFTPNDIVIDFGLPVTIDYSGKDAHGRYDIASGTATYGDVTVDGNKVTYTPTRILQDVDTVTLTNTANGTVTFKVYPATTVYYEEGFATYSGTWSDTGSKGTRTQATEVAGKNVYVYGYDPAYSGSVSASNGTQATSTADGDTASFAFTGTGVDIYANSTGSTGWLAIKVSNSQGTVTYKLVKVLTALVNGGTDATNFQAVKNGYNVPVASFTGLDHGAYQVTITHVGGGDAVNLDGFRVYGTLADQSNTVYTADHEDNPSFIELRDQVLAYLGASGVKDSQYADQIAKNLHSQVYASGEATSGAVIVTAADASYTENQLTDLLDNGPKNEIYLKNGQALVFTVKTKRVVQIGLKALDQATTYKIDNGATENLNSSTDMFYTVKNAGVEEQTITITNTGDGILSITKLKVCDDPAAALGALTAEDLIPALESLGYQKAPATVEPVEPVDPVTPTVPEEPEEPVVNYADAELTVALVDYTGKQVASAVLTANGVEGEQKSFSAEEILAAAKAQMPGKYALVDEKAVAGASVAYGESKTVTVQVGKLTTLKITYVGLFGRKVGTATITKVQTSGNSCQFTAAEIRSNAPASSRLVVWLTNVKVPAGSEMSLIVSAI